MDANIAKNWLNNNEEVESPKNFNLNRTIEKKMSFARKAIKSSCTVELQGIRLVFW